MKSSTFAQLESAFEALKQDASGRAKELAQKSSAGTLSEKEKAEFEAHLDMAYVTDPANHFAENGLAANFLR